MKTATNPRTVSLPFSPGDSADGGDALSTLASAGLVARGVVYGVIGILSVGLATGAGGKTENQTGALRTIAHQPLGTVALIAVAVGLGAYAAWRLLEGASGYQAGEKASAFDRTSAIVSGIAYAALCAAAIEILVGSRPSGGGARQAAAGVLGWPGGPVYVIVAGAVLLGSGIYQGYKGVTKKFLTESRVQNMSPEARKGFTALGVAGHIARGVTFLLVGYGVIKAAVNYSPKSAVGLDGALQELVHASYGPILLAVVAAGFIAFGLYSITDALYHRV